jgi:hypothetical protein
MPIEYTLERGGALVMAEATGALNLDSFMSLRDKLLNDPGLKTPHDTLLDVRAVKRIDISEGDLNVIARSLTSGPKDLGAARLAIVAHQERAFTLGNIYKTLDKGVEENVIVFFNLEVAKTWLGIT